jgi:hypothetical protein
MSYMMIFVLLCRKNTCISVSLSGCVHRLRRIQLRRHWRMNVNRKFANSRVNEVDESLIMCAHSLSQRIIDWMRCGGNQASAESDTDHVRRRLLGIMARAQRCRLNFNLQRQSIGHCALFLSLSLALSGEACLFVCLFCNYYSSARRWELLLDRTLWSARAYALCT